VPAQHQQASEPADNEHAVNMLLLVVVLLLLLLLHACRRMC
jgi:hypothetical protein